MHMCVTFKMTQTYDKQIGMCLFLYLKLFWGILDQSNEFVLVVCGKCHTGYTQSMCKVEIISAVCEIEQPSHLCGAR